jgi:predicted nucleotidyltransferase
MEHVTVNTVDKYLISKVLSGSRLYGTHKPDSDWDIRGVFVPSRAMRNDPFEEDKVLQRKDPDEAYYALKHFLFLCANGNPNILELLFAPQDNVLYQTGAWNVIVRERDRFITKYALRAFVKYASGQLTEALGKSKASSKRQVLVDAYGYDTKAAMNTCRLCYQFLQLDMYGEMRFPIPNCWISLREILNGEWTLEQFKDRAGSLIQQCTENLSISKLPDEVDKDYVAELYLELIDLWV